MIIVVYFSLLQQMMMMMMPMLTNPDGSFNQRVPQQFMHMPMTSMGAHIFNNMMMMPPPMTEQQGQQQDQGGTQKQQEQEVKPREDPAGGDEKLEATILNSLANSLEASSSPAASDDSRSRFSSSPHSMVPSNTSKVDIEGGCTISCDESKSKLPNDDSTLKCQKEKSDDNELSEEAQTPSADVVNDKPTNGESTLYISPLEELQQKPMSNDVVRTGDNKTPTAPCATEKEPASCSNGVDATKDSYNEIISKILNPATTLAKVAQPNSPMSPAMNLPDSEQKLFPSPATPQPETVPKRKGSGTIDVTLSRPPKQTGNLS